MGYITYCIYNYCNRIHYKLRRKPKTMRSKGGQGLWNTSTALSLPFLYLYLCPVIPLPAAGRGPGRPGPGLGVPSLPFPLFPQPPGPDLAGRDRRRRFRFQLRFAFVFCPAANLIHYAVYLFKIKNKRKIRTTRTKRRDGKNFQKSQTS